jgi:hypothetical protein
MEFDPSQADIAQEVVVEIAQRQHLAVRGNGTFPAEKGGEKRKHRHLLHRYFRQYGNNWQNKSGGVLRQGSASGVGAALVGQEAEKAVHRRVIGPADQGRGLPFLCHQSRQQEPLEVVRERRSRNAEALLDLPDGQARLAGPHQGTVDLESGGVPERFELLGCLFDVHGNSMDLLGPAVKRYFQF